MTHLKKKKATCCKRKCYTHIYIYIYKCNVSGFGVHKVYGIHNANSPPNHAVRQILQNIERERDREREPLSYTQTEREGETICNLL